MGQSVSSRWRRRLTAAGTVAALLAGGSVLAAAPASAEPEPRATGSIAVADNNAGITLNSAGTAAYVSHHRPKEQGGKRVSAVSLTATPQLAAIEVGDSPNGIAMNTVRASVYVANGGSNTVSVINTLDNTVTATIPLPGKPANVAVTPDGNWVYVTLPAAGTVAVLDASSNTVKTTLTGLGDPSALAVSRDGTQVYVTTSTKSAISVIDVATNTLGLPIPGVLQPWDIAVHPQKNIAYVTSMARNSVSVIDLTTNTITAVVTVPASPLTIAVSPDGKTAYLTHNLDRGTLTAIDTATLTLTDFGLPGRRPADVAVSHTDRDFVYVASSAHNKIWVLAAPILLPFSAPSATKGIPYTAAIPFTEGTQTSTLEIAQGTLPGGLTLNGATGEISGTPTVGGEFPFTLRAAGSVGSVTREYTLAVNAPPVITAATPPRASGGSPYSFSVTTAGHPAPRYELATGALPEGLELAPETGVVSGTPTELGTFDFTVSASNGVGPAQTAGYSLTVDPSAPQLTSPPPPAATAGAPYTHTVTASGFPAPTFAASPDSLPTGLTLDATTGVLSGTTTTVGEHPITITASNGTDPAATADYTLSVNGVAPKITSGAPSVATAGIAYLHTVRASGHPAPSFALTAGALPSGFALDAASGTISGSTTDVGTHDFTITASNGIGPDATADHTIAVDRLAPTITSGAPAAATAGSPYAHTLTATGHPAPSFTTSALPDGLTLDGASGVIQGTTTAVGSHSVTVTASNGANPDAVTSFTLVVSGVAPVITSGAPDPATAGTPYSHTVAATGYPTPTFTISSGALPAGLSLNAESGAISGTTVAAGSHAFTVTASNGAGAASTSYTLTVDRLAPRITSGSPDPATAGVSYEHTLTATGYPAPLFTASGLPSGLSVNAITGAITGITTEVGNHHIVVAADNGMAPIAQERYTLTVNGVAPTLTSAAPATAMVGARFFHAATATGYPAPTFSVTAGALPAGLSLNADSGEITGTPSSSGISTFTVSAANGIGQPAVHEFTLTVHEAPAISSSAPPAGTAGTAYAHTLSASGSPAPRFVLTAGSLPSGLALDPESGEIGGIPDRAASSTFTVAASNGIGADATAEYSITITAGAVATLAIQARGGSGDGDKPVMQGDTITLNVTGMDANGNPAGDLTPVATFSSDVAADVIDGNRITFPTASPHTITARVGDLSTSFLIEVTPVTPEKPVTPGIPENPDGTGTPDGPAAPAAESPSLSTTGVEAPLAAAALALLLIASGAFAMLRRRERNTRDS